METSIIAVSQGTIRAAEGSPAFNRLLNSRLLSSDKWVELHASGTLRKNKRIGFSWSSQYRIERTAWEFGWHFEMAPKSKLTLAMPITAGDCKACTETGWHIERLIERNPFEEDIYEVKYIRCDTLEPNIGNKPPREGVGIIVKQTCANWIPGGHIVFAFSSVYNPINNEWSESNPL